jgi:hypothetical protein
MRYSNNQETKFVGDGGEYLAQGGMVTYAMSPLTDASRTAMKTLVNSLQARWLHPAVRDAVRSQPTVPRRWLGGVRRPVEAQFHDRLQECAGLAHRWVSPREDL